MKLPSRIAIGSLPAILVLLVCGFGVEPTQPLSTPVIITAAGVYKPLAALRGEERFPEGAQLMLVQGRLATPLIEGFATTADADVSFDGNRLLFSAKENPQDKWSTWEFTLEDRSVRKVISGDTDVIRPMYLPDDRFVYARSTPHGYELETAKLDGSGILVLTYMTSSALPETVLADGRILFQAGYPLGTDMSRGAVPELFLVYSDGSGIESYRCDHGSARWGGVQLASGDVVFTHGSRLARFTSPLDAEAAVAAPRAEYAGIAVEAKSGQWVVSAKSHTDSHYALKLWKPGLPFMENILLRNGEDLVQPVLLAPRIRPNHHPTALRKWNYANVMALDARQSRDGALKRKPVSVRLEGMESNGNALTLGTAMIESDGSFFVRVPGDKPIRFTLLDERGAPIRKEQGWFWMRNGEQRYCVGCHAGPEHAPANHVPEVLLRSTNPTDLTGQGQSATRGGQ
jgi:hypothetical protein